MSKGVEANETTTGALSSPQNDIMEEEVTAETSGKWSESTILNDNLNTAISTQKDQAEPDSRDISPRTEDTDGEQLPGRSKTVRFPAAE